MTRGNQRELARAKNLKKQDQNKKKEDGLSAGARKERDADVMRQKQQAAAAKKEAAAAAGQASGGGGGKKWWKGSSPPRRRNNVDKQTAVDTPIWYPQMASSRGNTLHPSKNFDKHLGEKKKNGTAFDDSFW